MMRRLSWKQPYAELMFHGKIETRTWHTDYRGLVLIVASRQPYSQKAMEEIAGTIQVQRIDRELGETPLLYGHAIGIGELYNCRPMHPEDSDACFVAYKPGLWCHEYRDVRRIHPYPLKGTMGWKGLNALEEAEVLKRVIYEVVKPVNPYHPLTDVEHHMQDGGMLDFG